MQAWACTAHMFHKLLRPKLSQQNNLVEYAAVPPQTRKTEAKLTFLSLLLLSLCL